VIERLDRLLSTYRDDSEVMQLARTGHLAVSPETLDIIQLARELSLRSGGAFDPLVAPLVALWKEGGQLNRVPAAEAIGRARLLLDWRDVVVNPRNSEVSFARPGMALDFGAIGKGYAVDRAAESLERDGIHIALVASGGSSHRLLGHPPGGCWEIGIRHPEDADRTVAWLRLGAAGVGSHSIHGQGVDIGGKRYGHILDPATGYPAAPSDPLWSVTLIGAEATSADALGAAVVVLGAARGDALVQSVPGLQALLIVRGPDGAPEFHATPGLVEVGVMEGLPMFVLAGDPNCGRGASATARPTGPAFYPLP
jgi:thiamine biosynthesis lipoprotein